MCIWWYQGQGQLQKSNIKVTFLKKWPFWGHCVSQTHLVCTGFVQNCPMELMTDMTDFVRKGKISYGKEH